MALAIPRPEPRRRSAPGRWRMSTSISARRRQVVISSGERSASSSISRSVLASSDSGIPNMRSGLGMNGSARASIAWTGSVASASGHIACSSRGGPGSTITAARRRRHHQAGRGARRGRSLAPTGTIACLRLAARSASGSNCIRFAKPARIAAIRASISSSRSSSTPANRATISAVRSSAVGPRPPLVTIRSSPRPPGSAAPLQVLRAVADHHDLRDLHPALPDALGQPGPVAVRDPAGQDLRPGDDDSRADAHAGHSRGRRRGAG